MSRLFLALVALFLAAPVAIIAGVSVNAQQSLVFPPKGLSLRWYQAIFTDPDWRGALFTSVSIAVLAAALAVLIALPIAYALWRRATLPGRIVQLLGVSPFVLPPVITALGALAFWSTVGFYGSSFTVVVSHAIFFTSLPLVTLTLGFSSIDREIVEAARTMGASEAAVRRTIVLPMIRPYLVSGFAFAFVLSLNEYIIAYMTVGFTMETVPIKIFNALRYGYTPVMASISVLFVALAALVFGLVARFGDLPKLLGAWERR
ncbi:MULTISPECIES: ABC transporter permease [Aureimonas]|jgi:putative spermidine/putrescine transport system permease protein|uniref:Putative spermidine/putrescine transport system permease protein n=1 Tax=Aureimonas phyllosphaerae TaxID=1166078 RepID=A0A7W6FV96_9HYPH|nr:MULTISPECIES: ABC transporter permease [Aureimonas]KQQ81137.1 spermidine/putrescine ABC transporter permease [Aureimonas sp. Leaf324]MBB3936933.1 putative spermidine/putrescine transport system permease protein [Aureimonas phyllosphaerae]MBB3960952.1 putative spermidine/putrescine transport system permease protein [Aureimonas phyllosphaerae]SFF27582.1 putative spermidine/putrescine transport system permease protein [Aureimonas phyllosphaerae]